MKLFKDTVSARHSTAIINLLNEGVDTFVCSYYDVFSTPDSSLHINIEIEAEPHFIKEVQNLIEDLNHAK